MTFSPNPLVLQYGGFAPVRMTLEKQATAADVQNGGVTVQLVDADVFFDDLLEEGFAQIIGACTAGNMCKFRKDFDLKCENPFDEIRGIHGRSGESTAEPRIQFKKFGTNYGVSNPKARCVQFKCLGAREGQATLGDPCNPPDDEARGSGEGVGGIAELPDVAATPLETDGSSGPSAGVLAGSIAGAVLALSLGCAAWYARRRTR